MVYSEVKPALQRDCEGQVACRLTPRTGQSAEVQGKERILVKTLVNKNFVLSDQLVMYEAKNGNSADRCLA